MTADKIYRMAVPDDSAAMLDIYAPFVRDTAVSFECEIPTISEFADRIEKLTKDLPWLVCIIDGKIVGYAYASKHRERAAYQWSVEASVYIDSNYHRLGIARELYTKLFELLKLQGYYNVYAGVSVPNSKSEGLHEALGFKAIGIYHNVGFKHNKWLNSKWYELTLTELPQSPKKPTSISDLQATDEFLEIIG